MSSKLFKVLVTRRIPREAIDILRSKCSLDIWDSDECIPTETLHERVKCVDGLFCLLTDKVGSSLLDNAGHSLKVVSTMSVGVDHIDLQECSKRGISIGYTPDVLTAATAEFTLALLLSTSRRVLEAATEAKCGGWGTWKPMWMCGPSLDGSTVGIVGLGRIGIATLERLRPFGPKRFLYNNTKRKSTPQEKSLGVEYASVPKNVERFAFYARSLKILYVTAGSNADFDTLLEESDFVLCMCALTPDTTNLFNKAAFDKMKNTAIFINAARGGIVDQEDLTKALKKGSIAAAGLDVTTPEPLPTNHPLFNMKNCVITPHIASASLQTRTRMATLAAENLIRGLEGKEMPAQYIVK